MKRTAFRIVLWFLPLWAPLTLSASNGCEPISPATKDRLVRYVHDKFQLASATAVELIDSEPIADSCYRKVYFRRADTSEQIMMFLSSDQRFLSRELFDSTVDFTEERKDEQRRLEMELAKGDLPTKGDNAAPLTIVLFSDF